MQQHSTSVRANEFKLYIVHLSSIKSFLAWDTIGGLAFFMIGKIAFNSDLMIIILNVIGTQMLHYLLPAIKHKASHGKAISKQIHKLSP